VDGHPGANGHRTANNGVATLLDSNIPYAHVFLSESATFGLSAYFIVEGGSLQVKEVADPDSAYTTTKDNAGTINIYAESNIYKIQNKTGSSIEVRGMAFVLS